MQTRIKGDVDEEGGYKLNTWGCSKFLVLELDFKMFIITELKLLLTYFKK